MATQGTRPSKTKILIAQNTINDKLVDSSTRQAGYAITFDATLDKYIHSEVLTTASVTYEQLDSVGDVGNSAGQLLNGDYRFDDSEIIISNDGNTTHIGTLQTHLGHVATPYLSKDPVISDNGDGTISITEGEAYMKITNTHDSNLKCVVVPAIASIPITEEQNWIVYVDYNSGTPTYAAMQSIAGYFYENFDKLPFATVINIGTEILVNDFSNAPINGVYKNILGQLNYQPIRYLGGLSTSHVGTRQFSVTAGAVLQGNEYAPIASVNTSTGSTFTQMYYVTGSGWTRTSGQTTINNLVYNDISTGLVTLPATPEKWINYWLYYVKDTPSFYAVIVGQTAHASLAAATASGTPSILPPEVSPYYAGSLLVAKITVSTNDATQFIQIQNPFTTVFQTTAAATQHDALSNINLAGSGVTYGHISALAQTIYGAKTFNSAPISATFTSTATTGTSPLSIASTTLVSNLNSDLLDSQHGAYYLNRTNHTGTQLAATISDFDTEVSNNTDVAANTAARHVAVTVTDSSTVDFTLSTQNITASVIQGGLSLINLGEKNFSSLTAKPTTISGYGITDFNGSGLVASTAGTISFVTDNSSNWDDAYDYSQVGHLELSVYDANINGIVDGAQSIENFAYMQESGSKGDPLYVASSGTPAFMQRSKTNTPSTLPCVALASEDFVGGDTIKVVTAGILSEIDTTSYSLNQLLYIGATGGLTGTKPTSYAQAVAQVSRVGGSDGEIIILLKTLEGTGSGFHAETADSLHAAVTLWGQSFDGSSNITGSLSGVTDLTASGTVTANTIVKTGGDGSNVLLDDGTTAPLSGLGGGGGATIFGAIPLGVVDGSNYIFDVGVDFSQIEVIVSGVTMINETDYTVSGTSILFESGSIPQVGEWVIVNYSPILGEVALSVDNTDLELVSVSVLSLKDNNRNGYSIRSKSDLEALVASNVIGKYIVLSSVDLEGDSFDLSYGCTLEFVGGSFSNGTIVLDGYTISGDSNFLSNYSKLDLINNVLEILSDCKVTYTDNAYGSSHHITITSNKSCEIKMIGLLSGYVDFSGCKIKKDMSIGDEDLGFYNRVDNTRTVSTFTNCEFYADNFAGTQTNESAAIFTSFGASSTNAYHRGVYTTCKFTNIGIRGTVTVDFCYFKLGYNNIDNHEIIHSGSNSVIRNSEFDGSGDDGILLGADIIDTFNSQNILIQGNRFFNIVSEYAVTSGYNIITTKSHYNDGNAADSNLIGQRSGIMILNNRFEDYNSSCIEVWNGLRDEQVDVVDRDLNLNNVLIDGNFFKDCPVAISFPSYADRVTISNNHMKANASTLLSANASYVHYDIVIDNNTVIRSTTDSSNSCKILSGGTLIQNLTITNNRVRGYIWADSTMNDNNGLLIIENNNCLTWANAFNKSTQVIRTDGKTSIKNNFAGSSPIDVTTTAGRSNSYKIILWTGYEVFDTTLGKKVIYNGVNWVDTDGNII